ncbi:YaeQ family protein [Algiphilus sp.]|uniref:YaeQ family protein n=1 Tax=Algiphilus sp. TaxID=1872431 RepID=UPI003C3F5188
MALTATLHHFTIQLADMDRGVYADFGLRVAQQPSETAVFMLVRVLAYCLEYTDGIALTEGVAASDEPAVVVRDMTGRITRWIEVGAPDAERVHRGSKLAGSAAVYAHRDPQPLLAQYVDARIHRATDVPVLAFERAFLASAADALQRRSKLAVSVTEGQVYLDIDGANWASAIQRYSAAGA